MANRSEIKEVIQNARRWVEQETAWGDQIYATERRETRNGGLPKAAGNPERQREVVLSTDTTRRPTGIPASPAPSPTGFPAPQDSPEKTAALQSLYDRYNTCTRCPLGTSRLKFVFGVGNPNAEVMFIGEGPGYDEDHQGEPFIGRAGKLLDKMMESIGLSRKSVYIANIVKCHAMINPQTPHERGNDRPPTTLESETCSPILQQQIAVIQPRIIVTLGSPSTRGILATQEAITKIRGRFFPLPLATFKNRLADVDLFQENQPAQDFAGFTPEQLVPLEKIQVLPMFHPAALLRNPNLKKETWEDLKLLRETLRNGERRPT